MRTESEDSDELGIGERLRELRRSHRLSMRQLSAASSVSVSLISQVERGLVEPSISTLKRLAAALDTTITHFFSERVPFHDHVVCPAERRKLKPPGAHGVVFELLTPSGAQSLEAIHGCYQPGATTGPDPIEHEGEEWGMVLKGRLMVRLGAGQVFFLDPGDAIWFPSSVPHWLLSIGDEEMEYLWVNTPSSF